MINFYNLIVVGGGASGIMCAIRAMQLIKDKNFNVLILEKNNKIGKKILASGNGKCNIGNTNVFKDSYNNIFAYNFVKESLNEYVSIFSSLGLLIKTLDNGLMYPYSEMAISVVDVLRENLEHNNVKVELSECVESIKNLNAINNSNEKSFKKIIDENNFYYEKNKINYEIKTKNEKTFLCEYLVIATGSEASGGSDFTKAIKNIGHSINTFTPSLTPLKCNKNKIAGLNGVRIKCDVTLLKDNIKIAQKKGELLFKKDTLSGIVIMQLSRFMSKDKTSKYSVVIDILSDLTEYGIIKELNKRHDEKYLFKIDKLHTGITHKLIMANVFNQLNIKKLKKENISTIANMLKNYTVDNLELLDMSNAQISSGGVPIKEINGTTFESKICDNLYIVGEFLDVDGDCGGYNLMFCFLSGYRAGSEIARYFLKGIVRK